MDDRTPQKDAAEFLNLWQREAQETLRHPERLLSLFSLYATGQTSVPWSAPLQRMAEEPEFAAALREETARQAQTRLHDMERYAHAHYARTLPEPECVWQRGNCRLLHFSAPRRGGKRKKKNPLPALLLIPSLINRYYILDLTESNSLARFLAAQGFPVFLVDWGVPGTEERDFDCEHYVTRYLCAIGEELRARGHAHNIVLGHCMAGLLTLAFATIRPELLDRVVLLATPWDFHADPGTPLMLNESGVTLMERALAGIEYLPGEFIRSLFYLRDPRLFHEKLEQFHELEEGSAAQERFLAVEHWVNGCVPLTRGVARDGFIRWATHNEPCKGEWRVGGRKIIARDIAQPALVVTPLRDRVVPPACALPLATSLPAATHLTPDTGHIGVLVGSHAKEAFLEPLLRWLHGN
jgi:polyhydroxyalkanoate synthase